jgi:hypothetical protein
MAQKTFGGLERKEIPAEDFAGKSRSFPIVTPADVSDAAASIGRAGEDNYSSEELKARIIKIAKRKGDEFVKALPKKWQDEMEEAFSVPEGFIDGVIVLREAITLKARVKAALKALQAGLSDKSLSKAVHAALEHLNTELTKTWGDLAADAENDEDENSLVDETESISYNEWYNNLMENERQLIEDHIRGLKSALEKERARKRPGTEIVDYTPLNESALVEGGGRVSLKIIKPGWGSSGYYPADVLERDGPKAFTRGTKMYWNHPTKTQEAEQPERNLNDLAAVLETDAVYRTDGKDGPGLYADATVFERFAPALKELAPHIGVSICAFGKMQAGEVDGRKGPVIEAITVGKSVDFVTEPGAGGKVLELFEAARGEMSNNEVMSTIASALAAKYGAQTYLYVRDVYNDWFVYETSTEDGNKLYKSSYVIDDNSNVTLGEPVEVTLVSQYQTKESKYKEIDMSEIELKETQAQVKALQSRLLLRDAKDLAEEHVSKTSLPANAQVRVVTHVLQAIPLSESGELDRDKFVASVTEAAKSEVSYLAEVTKSAKVTGMGPSVGRDEEVDKKAHEALKESFRISYRAQGKSADEAEALAEIAAEGR